MSYTNQGNIEAYLKRNLSEQEEQLLEHAITAVENYIDDKIGGSYGTTDVESRFYDGGSTVLNIDYAHDVTAVELVNSEEDVIRTYELNKDFELTPRNDTLKRFVELRRGRFPNGISNIKVTAKFSKGDLPKDIEFLATYLVAQIFSDNVMGNLKSESIEGYSRTFSDVINENPITRLILERYSHQEVLL